MKIIGLDLHKRESQLSSKADDGTITDRCIVTSRERFTAVLGGRPRARILLEASTESEWVARHLESLGHEVIVADPNYAPMYANRSRRTKTDKLECVGANANRRARRRLAGAPVWTRERADRPHPVSRGTRVNIQHPSAPAGRVEGRGARGRSSPHAPGAEERPQSHAGHAVCSSASCF
jgi:transposase